MKLLPLPSPQKSNKLSPSNCKSVLKVIYI
jgi:hypothetical protein